jgi:hypothetical protein
MSSIKSINQSDNIESNSIETLSINSLSNIDNQYDVDLIKLDNSTYIQYTKSDIIKYKDGCLFSSSTSLAHCVSADLAMGRGIALEFKKLFGNVKKLKSVMAQVNDVIILVPNDKSNKLIFYLVTKQVYWGKPSIKSFTLSLLNLKQGLLKYGIKEISIPRIGSGLDKLQWKKCSIIISNIFYDSDISVIVYTI